MSINDGGPAFPQWGTGDFTIKGGLTIRDYFAAKAMVALHCSDARGGSWTVESAAICAKNAYAMADAMLAERSKAVPK